MEKGIKTAGAKLRGISARRKWAALAAMVAAAVATVVGLAVPAGASPMAVRPAAVTGAEHLQAMSTSGTATTQGVIAWGIFTNYGIDHENNSNAATSTDLFTFAGGSFKVTHTTKKQSQTVNAKACFYRYTASGIFKLSAGTGKYKGISGKGTFTLTGMGFGPKTKSGACNENANPVVAQQVIDANGTVTLP
jgi:hypothetical protein